MIFAQLPFKRKFDFSEFSDIDWLDWIKYRKTEWNDMGDEAVLLPTKSGNEELCSELSPSPQWLPNDDKVGVQSVYGVSDNSPLPARYQSKHEIKFAMLIPIPARRSR